MTEDKAPAAVHIQWKGTDVCLDFYCYTCGRWGHFDGDFTYALKCLGCGAQYAMPHTIALVPLPEAGADAPMQIVEVDAAITWDKRPAARAVTYQGESDS